MSLFIKNNMFSASTNLTYGPHKTWLNTYYLQTVKIYINKIVQDTLKFGFKIFMLLFSFSSSIVQFIFYFWSFEISRNILRNQKTLSV